MRGSSKTSSTTTGSRWQHRPAGDAVLHRKAAALPQRRDRVLVDVVALAALAQDERRAVGAGQAPRGAVHEPLDGIDGRGGRELVDRRGERGQRLGAGGRTGAWGVRASGFRLPAERRALRAVWTRERRPGALLCEIVPYTSAMHALVAGATGFIGGVLVRRLLADGVQVRALVRDRERARGRLAGRPAPGALRRRRARSGHARRRGRGDRRRLLPRALDGPRGGAGDFEEREARSARAFAQMCAAAGVGRVVYLGGLGDEPGSKHLRSRDATARRSPSTARR